MQTALATAKAQGITRNEDSLRPEEIDAAAPSAWPTPARRLTCPHCVTEIENAAASANSSSTISIWIRWCSQDSANRRKPSQGRPSSALPTISGSTKTKSPHWTFYQQPYQRRALTFDMLEELHTHLSQPP